MNFGQTVGPVAAGILMALWIGLLIRWWEQRQSLLRLVLFMLGAALTFNLGRDISLLVLWPVIFAYFFSDLRRSAPRGDSGKCRKWQLLLPPVLGQCRFSSSAGSSSAAVLCLRLAARCIDGTKGAPEVEQTRFLLKPLFMKRATRR